MVENAVLVGLHSQDLQQIVRRVRRRLEKLDPMPRSFQDLNLHQVISSEENGRDNKIYDIYMIYEI